MELRIYSITYPSTCAIFYAEKDIKEIKKWLEDETDFDATNTTDHIIYSNEIVKLIEYGENSSNPSFRRASLRLGRMVLSSRQIYGVHLDDKIVDLSF